MKKNFTVNIGGNIFHIDEDAYEKLSAYLESLRNHFERTEGRDEILADIESRISEMLREKIQEGSQVIAIADISDVIAKMGEPADFDGEGGAGAEQKEVRSGKRYFRDPDNKIIGGVCGGLAAYFHTDPLWIRLAFALVTLLGFGSGIIAYLILWLAVPEARTTSEKLEMRGEKITISSIERSFSEELKETGERIGKLSSEAKETFHRGQKEGKTFFERALNLIIMFLGLIFRVVVVFFGLLFIVMGLFLVIGVIISLVDTGNVLYVSSLGISTFSLPVFLRLFLDAQNMSLTLLGLCLVIGVPLVMLIYTGARLIFRFQSPSRFVGIPALSLFLGGLIICIFTGIGLLRDFNQRAFATKSYSLAQPAGNTLNIGVADDQRFEKMGYNENHFLIGNWNMISSGDSNIYFGLPRLEVLTAEADSFSMLVYAGARGETRAAALERAGRISYHYSQNDTVLQLDPFFFLNQKDKFRNQEIRIFIRVPVGSRIKMGSDTHIFFKNHFEEGYTDLSGKYWIMTENGLKESRYPAKTEQSPAGIPKI